MKVWSQQLIFLAPNLILVFQDFKNDYKTLYPWYMESIWWVFSELWNKGLVYKGVKVMPYSTACNTPLSNFESGQNYKEVVDPAGWYSSNSAILFLFP